VAFLKWPQCSGFCLESFVEIAGNERKYAIKFVIASAAKQSMWTRKKERVDCFTALAMTALSHLKARKKNP
jgi:hypothetical protein